MSELESREAIRVSTLIFEGLDCANCAEKIREHATKVDGVEEVAFNFMTKKMKISHAVEADFEDITSSIRNITKKLEPDVVVIIESDNTESPNSTIVAEVLILENLDCANCGEKIRSRVEQIEGINRAGFSFITKELTIEYSKNVDAAVLVNEIARIASRVESGVGVRRKVKDKASKKVNSNRREIYELAIGALVFIVALVVKLEAPYNMLLFLLSYLISGKDVLLKAGKNILRGQVFDENFLMTIASLGAFAIGEYPESVGVMIFYKVGELFQSFAVDKSRKSIESLMNIRPDYANLVKESGSIRVSPLEVEVGALILVKPGEKVPLDGIVCEGMSYMDTSALTGESVPMEASVGVEVLAGFVNKSGLLKVEVTKGFGETTVAKILDLVQNAASNKANTENFITKFAKYYTPIVVIAALCIAVVPPLVIGGAIFSDWLYRALTFLVVSCPCALVISIPMSFFGGIGGASKCGIMIKGGNYLEALNYAEIVVFDKTGTLTQGEFEVVEIREMGIDKDELLRCAAYAEYYSNHPIAKSIIRAYGRQIDESKIEKQEEKFGKGVKVVVDGCEVLVGNYDMMKEEKLDCEEIESDGTVGYVALDGKYIGALIIADEVRKDSKKAISLLKDVGVKTTVMLTGDVSNVATNVARELGIDKVYSNMLPTQKVEKVEQMMSELSPKGKLIFVGDGINDAAVITRADVGIAMGGLGSDAAIEASDVVIMTDEPSKVATAIRISKRTRRIVVENIVFALGVKGIVLILGALGLSTMWEAVFADVGVSVIAILNSMKALNVSKLK